MAPAPPVGPALPWAHVEPAAAASTSAAAVTGEQEGSGTKLAYTLEEMKLDIGARIEVMWEIEDDENKTVTHKWWGATIDNATSVQPPAPDQMRKAIKYLLRYEAFEGFEAEDREVMFMSEKLVFDLESESPLMWRRPGEVGAPDDDDLADEEMVEEEEEEEQEVFGKDAEEATAVPLDHLREVMHALDPADDRAPLVIPNITPFQERLVAEHLQTFIGGFMAHIQEKKGPGEVITAEDVRAYTSNKTRPPSSK